MENKKCSLKNLRNQQNQLQWENRKNLELQMFSNEPKSCVSGILLICTPRNIFKIILRYKKQSEERQKRREKTTKNCTRSRSCNSAGTTCSTTTATPAGRGTTKATQKGERKEKRRKSKSIETWKTAKSNQK